MDDIATILQTATCTARLLKRTDELVGWARMKIKPSKSRSLSLRKGVRSDHITFVAGSEQIPLLADEGSSEDAAPRWPGQTRVQYKV